MPVQPPLIVEGLFSYQIGGSERVSADLAKEFSRRGYRVLCFAFYDSTGPIREELEQAGIRCLDLNYQNFGRLSRRVTYQMRVWRMLRQEGVSALHVHHATALILCGIPARIARVPRVVMTEHGLYQLQERPSYRKTATRYCRFTDEITVVEPTQADYFCREMHCPSDHVHYVANGVKLVARTAAKTLEARRQLAIPEDAFAYFYVGRLNPVKDLGTLLKATAALSKDVARRTQLYLVGDGVERANLEAQCKALGLEQRVTFLGARKNITELLMAADGFVMSSLTEGLPMALLEAMACGVPCIATSVGGIPQLFAEGRGIHVPAADPMLLAAAMEQLVGDPALRARIAASALAHVQRTYSLDAIADRYLELLGLPRVFAASPALEATPARS